MAANDGSRPLAGAQNIIAYITTKNSKHWQRVGSKDLPVMMVMVGNLFISCYPVFTNDDNLGFNDEDPDNDLLINNDNSDPVDDPLINDDNPNDDPFINDDPACTDDYPNDDLFINDDPARTDELIHHHPLINGTYTHKFSTRMPKLMV